MNESDRTPHVIVLAGPNGAGKSSTAPALLQGTLRVDDFINADVIAQGLSAFDPESVAPRAGRIMLERLDGLTRQRRSFAFETTLSGRTVLRRFDRCLAAGYAVHLIYLWLPSADMAVQRVRNRVLTGGHDVPEDVIRRRYAKSLVNFEQLYRRRATTWQLYDNSAPDNRSIVAYGGLDTEITIVDADRWRRIQDQVRDLEERKDQQDHD